MCVQLVKEQGNTLQNSNKSIGDPAGNLQIEISPDTFGRSVCDSLV